MKIRLVQLFLIIGSLLAATTIDRPVLAQTNKYFCDRAKDGTPITYALTTTGKKIPIIIWKSQLGNATSLKRCQEVSGRFQAASKEGVLQYITSGMMKGQRIICATNEISGPCRKMLFTLKPNQKPNEVIENLMKIGGYASKPIVQSSNTEPTYYYDFKAFIDENETEQ